MPNPFTAPNRHGELQDVTRDGQVNFGDTFLGDLLGVDGSMGLQGRAGMMKSLQGARRAMPVDPAAAQQAQQVATQGAPISEPPVAGPGEAYPPSPVTVTELGPDGMPMQQTDGAESAPISMEDLIAAGVVSAGAAGAGIAARKILGAGERVTPSQKNEVTLTPDEQGNVRVPRQTNRGARYETLTAQQAADGGWSVVGLNYEDSGIEGPNPTQKRVGQEKRIGNADATGGGGGIDNIDGSADDVGTSKRPNQGNAAAGASNTTSNGPLETVTNSTQTNRPTAGAEDAPIDMTQEMTPPPEGTTRDPAAFGGGQAETLVQSDRGPNGELIFMDSQRGDYVARDPNGGAIRAPDLNIMRRALQAIR